MGRAKSSRLSLRWAGQGARMCSQSPRPARLPPLMINSSEQKAAGSSHFKTFVVCQLILVGNPWLLFNLTGPCLIWFIIDLIKSELGENPAKPANKNKNILETPAATLHSNVKWPSQNQNTNLDRKHLTVGWSVGSLAGRLFLYVFFTESM